MAREMAEQPEAIARTLSALRPMRSRVRELARGRRQVLFVARGSSDNAAIYGRYLLEVHAHRTAGLAAPSVATHYRSPLDLSDALVVSISQSGQTEEIVQTQAWARACGAATVAVTNVADSALAADADLALVTRAGPERAVPATKTFTTQLTAVAVLATALADDPTALDADLDRVSGAIEALLGERAGVDAAATALSRTNEVLVSGRGLGFAAALETALKLEETCLRPVRGLSYADLRHGPIAIVDPQLVAIVLAPAEGPMVPGLTELLGDLHQRGAVTVGIGGDRAFADAADVAVAGPDLPETVAPIALVVAGQLVVETLARRLGLDPDAPRGLHKVTQTDR
ncbi:MAG TPA: SIS domain-containing protein [Segeticoccus sp.]|nr:SIS domain-containing protein [Segeticoccus sp.]